MAYLNRAAILNGRKSSTVTRVSTPEWGDKGFVYIRVLRGTDADEVQELCASLVDKKLTEAQGYARWCVLGLCDKHGKRLFSTKDVEALVDSSLAPLQRCAFAIMKANGIGDNTTRKKN